MDVNSVKNGKNDFLHKFKILMMQAELDNKTYLVDFLEKLLQKEMENLELQEYIYRCFDELNENIVAIYDFLLDKDAALEWYISAGYIYEERTSWDKYFGVMKECIEHEWDEQIFQDILHETNDFEEFLDRVNQEIVSIYEKINSDEKILETEAYEGNKETVQNEFYGYLKEENKNLNARIDMQAKELKMANSELKRVREEAYSLKTEMMQKEALLSEKDSLITSLQEECRKADMQIAFQSKKLLQKQETNCQLNLQLQAANENQHTKDMSYEEAYSKKEEEFLILSEKYETYIQRVSDLEKMVEERDTKIGELQKICAEYEAEVESLHNMLAQTRENKTFSYDDENMIFNDDEPITDTYKEIEPEEFQFGTNILTDVLEIKNNEAKVKKQSNFLANLLFSYQKKRFKNLPEQEQIGQINIKLIRNKYSKELMKIITSTLNSKNGISKIDLYEMISKKSDEEKIIRYCKAYA